MDNALISDYELFSTVLHSVQYSIYFNLYSNLFYCTLLCIILVLLLSILCSQYMNVIACRRKVRTMLCGRRGRCCCWFLVVLLLLLALYVLAVLGRQHAAGDPALNPFANPWLAKALRGGSGNNEPSGADGGLHHQQLEQPARDEPAMLDAPPAAAHPVIVDPLAKKFDAI